MVGKYNIIWCKRKWDMYVVPSRFSKNLELVPLATCYANPVFRMFLLKVTWWCSFTWPIHFERWILYLDQRKSETQIWKKEAVEEVHSSRVTEWMYYMYLFFFFWYIDFLEKYEETNLRSWQYWRTTFWKCFPVF